MDAIWVSGKCNNNSLHEHKLCRSLVPHEGTNRRYSTTITGLPTGETYFVRVNVLDRNQNIIFTSPEASATTSCQRMCIVNVHTTHKTHSSGPSSAPQNIRVEAPDPSHVRVGWTVPATSTWNCNDVQLELEVVEPSRNIPAQRFDVRQTSHVFDCRPGERWSVRMRTINNGGASEWSPVAMGQSGISGACEQCKQFQCCNTHSPLR
jgi:hypothetical protein